VLVDKARATRLAGQLREAGLVTNTVGRLDHRRREVELTGAGRELLAEARRLRLEFLGDALQAWNDADLEALASLIERFNASIREAAW
jgi:DNA-binding MarR family transcriptional regulator